MGMRVCGVRVYSISDAVCYQKKLGSGGSATVCGLKYGWCSVWAFSVPGFRVRRRWVSEIKVHLLWVSVRYVTQPGFERYLFVQPGVMGGVWGW